MLLGLLCRSLKNCDPLFQEVSSLCGVGDQVEWIKDQLTWMQCFLKDADAKQEGDERVKNWVRTVRGLAYNVEDIIDTFVVEIEPLRQQHGLMGSIKMLAFVRNEFKARHKLVSDIEHIKTMICSISESRSNYGLQNISLGEGTSSSSQSPQDWRQTSPDVQEQDFVGFEKDLETLVARLTTGEPRLCVVSVVGMGGLGKTTISRKVYNADAVGKHFDLRAWISVTQEYVVKGLLRAVLRCCVVLSAEELEKVEKRMSTAELRSKLSEYLKDKTYLIVLDDVWTYEAWNALKDAFPDMKNGSRILLTTRNKDVALHADARCPPHELRFLTENESWELFSKKTFLEQGTHCPQDLQKLGKEIVKRCQGLPLAIVVIGGLLSRKEPREWENVLKSISWQFVDGEVRISGILSLSYRDLPYHLKPCFLYLSIFPEDYQFRAKTLIELWVAEGFLQQRGDETLEEVGEDCLKELVQRSMVQVVERSSVGGIKSCRMHDLLRDLCISEAREAMLFEILEGNANRPHASTARRLAVHDNALISSSVLRFYSRSPRTRRLRSVFLISTHYFIKVEKAEMEFLFRGFKFLRVLSFHAVPIESLPNEIGELIHLRYLGCTGTSLKKFPSSIRNLGNLQILNVTSGYPIHITSAIEKMHQLRHLRVKCILNDPFPNPCVIEGHPQLDEMSNLQTLTGIVAGQWIHGCLGKLTNLRKLGIYLDSSDACEKEVYKSIVKLHCLESLFVSSHSKWGKWRMMALVPLTNLLKYLPKLCKLYLQGQINKLPDSCEFPINLAKLTLEGSFLTQDSLQMLEKLENLRILRLLEDSYGGKEMACSAHGFPRLEYLEFYWLKNLEEWKIEEGTLPSLLHLRIKKCPQLKMLPEGLQRMSALKKLDLWGMCQEFKNRLRKDDGDDWHKIQNITSIDIIDTWVQ